MDGITQGAKLDSAGVRVRIPSAISRNDDGLFFVPLRIDHADSDKTDRVVLSLRLRPMKLIFINFGLEADEQLVANLQHRTFDH